MQGRDQIFIQVNRLRTQRKGQGHRGVVDTGKWVKDIGDGQGHGK